MHPDDAQAALDDIKKRQEQSRAGELRHSSSLFNAVVLALVVLLSYASFDVPAPWNGAVILPVVALLALLAFVYLRRAPVLRKPKANEILIGAAAGIALAAVLRGLASAAGAVGLPTPHLLAAVAGAVGCLVVVLRAAGPLRRR
ncbi:hypothetical protein O7635_34140 [Asanoa sp. WMMD1127]|uniref:hypothetical protein n=1 Tax=Asanoa sp. WMMD1127 TaxID=3016107 RepID=UPI002416C3A9|nr:hypothetical protein [Asanoa sp. WMMD1127]MDG4826915.1 hypothetical protein [Asanoa sp. WMMD1127]